MTKEKDWKGIISCRAESNRISEGIVNIPAFVEERCKAKKNKGKTLQQVLQFCLVVTKILLKKLLQYPPQEP